MPIDYLDSLESAAISRVLDMTDGLPEGMFRCDCGLIDEIRNAVGATPNPYSSPICSFCQDTFLGK